MAHGRTLYEEVLRVPLIISPAGGVRASRIYSVVRMFDLYPTLPALCGIPCGAGGDAQTLFDPNTGALAATGNRVAFSELGQKENPSEWLCAMIDGPRKLIFNRQLTHDAPESAGTAFDLSNDQKEEAPNMHVSEAQRAGMEQRLLDASETWRRDAETYGPPRWDRLDEETLQNLNAIGYLPGAVN